MRVLPRREGPDLKRWLYVTKHIASIFESTTTLFPDVSADVQNTRFSAGQYISVSEQRKEWGKNNGPHLERIHGVEEVWAMCYRTPPPGWRLFGRFLAKDVFVGLDLREKTKDLAGRYEEVGEQVIARWDAMLGAQPLKSTDLGDYLGHTWVNRDDENRE